jgi:hypothetical protein
VSRIKGAKPSAALVVAVIALVAALGGGAVAGVAVTSLNKKDKKQVRKISKKEAKKLDEKIELLPGPQGLQGEQGEPGDPGPLGPTDGTSVNGAFAPPPTPQDIVEIDDFDTAIAGRLLVIKPASLSIGCNGGKAWNVWLVVDGDPVPGSGIDSIPSGEFLYGLTLSGVTADQLSAGTHTAAVGVECSGSTIAGGELNPNGGVSAVVLGG